jgi:hypothetical protein
VQATSVRATHFDLIENVSLDDVSNCLGSAIMLVLIMSCIILPEVVMN